MPDTRTLREQLQTYGTNGGILLTEEEFVDLVLKEVSTFSAESRTRLAQEIIHAKSALR